MKPLYLFLLMLTCTVGYSQNAYYDVLKLTAWYKMQDTSTKKIQQAGDMLVKILKYTGGSSKKLRDTTIRTQFRDLLMIYNKADTLYSFSKRYAIPKTVVLGTIKNATDTGIAHLDSAIRASKNESLRFEATQRVWRGYDSIQLHLRNHNQLPHIKDLLLNTLNNLTTPSTVNIPPDDTNYIRQGIQNLPSRDARYVISTDDSIAISILETVLRRYMYEKFLVFETNKKMADDTLYAMTIRLEPWTFRRLFPSYMNLHAEDATLSFKDERALGAKSFAETQKDINTAVATSSPQRLTDLNFPTQTEIIDAIAIYLARRTKQEATLFFIESLARVLKTDDLARDLFPETFKIMQAQEAYTSPRFGAKWRNAIAADYINLPQSIANSSYILKRFPNAETVKYFKDAVTFAGYVAKKYTFIDIMRTLYADSTKLNGEWTIKGVNALYIINQELQDTSAGRYWISPQAFFDMDDFQLKCLYDLIRIKYDTTSLCQTARALFSNPDTFKSKLGKAKQFYTELLTTLQQFYAAQTTPIRSADGTIVLRDGFWDTQRDLVSAIASQELFPMPPRVKQVLGVCQKAFFVYDYISNKNYVAAAENALEIIGVLTNQSPKTLINLTDREMVQLRNDQVMYNRVKESNRLFDSIVLLQTIRDTLQLYTDIKNKQFFIDRIAFKDPGQQISFLNALFGVHSDMSATDLSASIETMIGTIQSSLSGTYRDFRKQYDTTKHKVLEIGNDRLLYRNAKDITDQLSRLGQSLSLQNTAYFRWLTDFSEFLTEIASTKDRESLANVIESYALPPGSYRQKRSALFSMYLNAYVGGYGGWEKIDDQQNYRFVYGLTAPIGLSFNWGNTRKWKDDFDEDGSYINHKGNLKKYNQNSWTLDLSIVDIGSVVSYRMGASTDKGLPREVKWGQVFSPGAALRWGIRKTPFCIGVGMQYAPELRTINREQKGALRFHTTFAFDLPLIKLYRSK